MFASFGSILHVFAVFLWPAWKGEGSYGDPFEVTEEAGPNRDPFG